jgi:hypothetical protein
LLPSKILCLGLQVKLVNAKEIQEIKCTISPHKNTMKSIKKTPNAHNRFSKASFIIHKMLLQILVARFTHENMRERGKE